MSHHTPISSDPFNFIGTTTKKVKGTGRNINIISKPLIIKKFNLENVVKDSNGFDDLEDIFPYSDNEEENKNFNPDYQEMKELAKKLKSGTYIHENMEYETESEIEEDMEVNESIWVDDEIKVPATPYQKGNSKEQFTKLRNNRLSNIGSSTPITPAKNSRSKYSVGSAISSTSIDTPYISPIQNDMDEDDNEPIDSVQKSRNSTSRLSTNNNNLRSSLKPSNSASKSDSKKRVSYGEGEPEGEGQPHVDYEMPDYEPSLPSPVASPVKPAKPFKANKSQKVIPIEGEEESNDKVGSLNALRTPLQKIRDKDPKKAKKVTSSRESSSVIVVSGSSRVGRDIKAPLQWWRGEHIIYDINNEVLERIPPSEKSAHKPFRMPDHSKKPKRKAEIINLEENVDKIEKKTKLSNKFTLKDLSAMEKELHESRRIIDVRKEVINTKTREADTQTLAVYRQFDNHTPLFNGDSDESTFPRACMMIKTPKFHCGTIYLPPNSFKRSEVNPQAHEVYYLANAPNDFSVSVNIGGTEIKVIEGYTFHVPTGINFEIKNRSKTEPAKLFFSMIKLSDAEKEAKLSYAIPSN